MQELYPLDRDSRYIFASLMITHREGFFLKPANLTLLVTSCCFEIRNFTISGSLLLKIQSEAVQIIGSLTILIPYELLYYYEVLGSEQSEF